MTEINIPNKQFNVTQVRLTSILLYWNNFSLTQIDISIETFY